PDSGCHVAGMRGADPRPRPPELPIAAAAGAAADELLAGLPRPIVALHPGSGQYAPARRWPLARFVELGQVLGARYSAGLLVVGNEKELNARLTGAVGARDLSGRTSIPALGALLSKVDLLVTNDSGVMHVGAAAGAGRVAILGQTEPRAWAPSSGLPKGGGGAEIVELPLPCRPCLYRGRELGWRNGCATRECVGLLSVGRV